MLQTGSIATITLIHLSFTQIWTSEALLSNIARVLPLFR